MSTRIKGTKLTLTVGTIVVDLDATSVVLDSEEAAADITTFAEANTGGGRQFFLQITSTQSTDALSFWRYVWGNSGVIATFTLRPHGNAVATADQPHFTGSVTIPAKPKIGGEAGVKSVFTFDVRMDCIAEPLLKVS